MASRPVQDPKMAGKIVVFMPHHETICHAELKCNNSLNIWLTWAGCWIWWAPGWALDVSQSQSASSSESSASQRQTFCPAKPDLKYISQQVSRKYVGFPFEPIASLFAFFFSKYTDFTLVKKVILSPGRFLFSTGSAKWTGLKPWCRRRLFTSSHSICSCCNPETESNSGMKLWQISLHRSVLYLEPLARPQINKSAISGLWKVISPAVHLLLI